MACSIVRTGLFYGLPVFLDSSDFFLDGDFFGDGNFFQDSARVDNFCCAARGFYQSSGDFFPGSADFFQAGSSTGLFSGRFGLFFERLVARGPRTFFRAAAGRADLEELEISRSTAVLRARRGLARILRCFRRFPALAHGFWRALPRFGPIPRFVSCFRAGARSATLPRAPARLIRNARASARFGALMRPLPRFCALWRAFGAAVARFAALFPRFWRVIARLRVSARDKMANQATARQCAPMGAKARQSAATGV